MLISLFVCIVYLHQTLTTHREMRTAQLTQLESSWQLERLLSCYAFTAIKKKRDAVLSHSPVITGKASGKVQVLTHCPS